VRRRPHPTTARASTQVGCEANARDLIIYDGRDAIGFIRIFKSVFVAYGDGGRLIGRFPTQQAALRAIPSRRRQP
jgi:hypothetical protein